MAIELIDKIKQKNGGTFKLVDSEDVAYGDSSVEEEIKNVSKKIQEVASTGTTTEVVQEKVKEMAEQGLIQAYTIGDKTISERKTTFFTFNEQHLYRANWKNKFYYNVDGDGNVRENSNAEYRVHAPITLNSGSYYLTTSNTSSVSGYDISAVFSFVKNTRTGTITRLSDIVGSDDYHGLFTLTDKSILYLTDSINHINTMLSDIDLSSSDYIEGLFNKNIMADNVNRIEEECRQTSLQVADNKTNIDGLNEKTKVLTISNQYLLNENIELGKVYWNGTDYCVVGDAIDYKIWKPISLKAGTYHYKNLSLAFSVIQQQGTNSYTNLNSLVSEEDNGNHTSQFTVDYDFIFYACTYIDVNDSMLSEDELPEVFTENNINKIYGISEKDLKNTCEKTKVLTRFNQYLLNENIELGKVYWNGTDYCVVGDAIDYKIWKPISLKAGTYHYKNLSLAFSVIQHQGTNSYTNLNSLVSEEDNGNHTSQFTVNYDFIFYACTYIDVNDSMLSEDELPEVFTESVNKIYGISEKDLKTTVDKYKNVVDSYNNLTDEKQNNLFTSLVLNGNATFSSVNSISVSATMDGVFTNDFNANTSNLTLRIKGSYTCNEVSILLVYYNGSSWVFDGKLENITGGTLNHEVVIDSANYAVYKNAKKFKFLIMNSNDSEGTITLDSIEIYDLDYFRSNDKYNENFVQMTANIFNAIEINASNVNRLDLKIPCLTDANGKKYQLSVKTDGTLSTTPVIPNKTLFMGNSLIFGLDTDDSKGGHFGMCASDYTKDFVYYVKQAILDKNTSATFTDRSIALFEQCETDFDAENWINQLSTSFTNDIDLIVLQIGDNVSNQTRSDVFSRNFGKLLSRARILSNNARIIVVGCWYNAKLSRDTLIKECKNYGCEFVDITYLHTEENEATIGDTISYKDGTTEPVPGIWATHPGDKGMMLIAKDIISAINM